MTPFFSGSDMTTFNNAKMSLVRRLPSNLKSEFSNADKEFKNVYLTNRFVRETEIVL